MRSGQFAALILAALVVAAAAAAPQAPDIAGQPKDKQTEPVALRGCVAGTYLIEIDRNFVPDDHSGFLNAGARVRLVASRGLMRQLREHEGQFVEVSGTIKNPPRRMTRSKQLGPKARITVGKGSEPSNFDPATQSDRLELRMDAFTVLDHRCS